MLAAAADLLVEGGPTAVTIDAIVARSGVAKSTIYRHWESRDEVLVASIESCAPLLPEPDPAADVQTGLRAVLHAITGFLNDPEWARMLPAILLMKHHEAGIADLDQRLEREQDQVILRLLERAVDDGVLPRSADLQEAITLLVGPVVFAHLTGTVTVDEAFADRSLARFLAAYRADPART